MKLKNMVIIWAVIILVGGTGYVKNIIKLTDLNFEPAYKAETIRLVGLFPPVGAIVGFMDIDDNLPTEKN